MRGKSAIIVIILAELISRGAVADIDFSGWVGYEARGFLKDPQFTGQLSGVQSSLATELEFEWESEDRRQHTGFVPFARIDAEDNERTHGDIREAYWRYFSVDWEALVGVERVFWGVTESRHLVNVINQVDAVENIDQEDFLGQPMINLGLQKDYGKFDLFILPYFRERTFPGVEGRLRAPLIVDTGSAVYESTRGQNHIDVALRYSHSFGNWDMGWSFFHGTGREPTLVPGPALDSLIPVYNIISQLGLDLQYTGEAWLLKMESIARKGQGDTFGALVGGYEYTFYQAFDGATDIGLLTEYLYDGRDQTAPITTLQDDVFIGSRLAFNDTQNSAVLAGILFDFEDQTTGFRLEAERRLGQSWKVEIESQFFINVDEDNPAIALVDDDFILLSIKKYW